MKSPYERLVDKLEIAATEHQIQTSFVQWCRLSEAAHPELRLAFAVPNGGLRNIVTAVKLKKEGARAGVPDWIMPFPISPFIGLAIEFKRGSKGILSASQENYISLLRQAGWRVEICRDTESAISFVKEYLKGQK